MRSVKPKCGGEVALLENIIQEPRFLVLLLCYPSGVLSLLPGGGDLPQPCPCCSLQALEDSTLLLGTQLGRLVHHLHSHPIGQNCLVTTPSSKGVWERMSQRMKSQRMKGDTAYWRTVCSLCRYRLIFP